MRLRNRVKVKGNAMTDARLGFASYVVLALVGRGGAGAHDMAAAIQLGGQIYGGMAPSQTYAEAKRLTLLGLLVARIEPGLTTARTVYRLTERGHGVLVAYLREASPFPTLRQEVTLRLVAGDFLTDAEIVASVTAMRVDTDRIEAMVAAMEETAQKWPHRQRYLMLQHRLARRLIDTYRDWMTEVEAELSGPANEPAGGAPADFSGVGAGLIRPDPEPS